MLTKIQIVIKKSRQSRPVKNKRRALQYGPQKKGVCWRVGTMTPKKPCSANRGFARVKLTTGFVVTCHIPGERHRKIVKRFSTVFVRGGRTNDMPGVKYKIVRSSSTTPKKRKNGFNRGDLGAVFSRKKARSKYGTRNPFRAHRPRFSSYYGVGEYIAFKATDHVGDT